MLQRSRVREELLPPDDTPLKRARQDDVTIVGNAPGKLAQLITHSTRHTTFLIT